MAAAELSEEEATARIREIGSSLSVAVVNGPRAIVVSGDDREIDAFVATLERDGIFARRVNVDYASHGPHVDPLRDGILRALEGIRPRRAAIPILSTARVRICDGTELSADYWFENLRAPVRLGPGLPAPPLHARSSVPCLDGAGRQSVVARHESRVPALSEGPAPLAKPPARLRESPTSRRQPASG